MEEKCNCPEENISDWFEKMGCNQTYNQIKRDMSKMSHFKMDNLYDRIVDRFNQRYSQSLCHYAIINNKVSKIAK
jgi:hypothetical protein